MALHAITGWGEPEGISSGVFAAGSGFALQFRLAETRPLHFRFI